MRNAILILLATAIGAGSAGVALAKRDSPDIAFRKLLAGKTAGPPVDCIDTRRGTAQTSAYGDKLVYRFGGKLLYVSDTAGGCETVARGDILVTRQFSTQLCRGDIAQTVDRVARFPTGSCALGPFTPYRKP